ncbi:ClpP/crotonase-like domain-containing protein, partial [Lipomyces japonicus]|uniref:ClpP/crotonase-like domain-containing protein n=1 Tax=Lipomyces japonicus TaxID=56871 RepID=UPI0034CD572F
MIFMKNLNALTHNFCFKFENKKTAIMTYSHFNIDFPAANVAHVEINRPQKLNAFNKKTYTELRDIFNSFSTNKSVNVIILSGSGPAFTSGLELSPDVLEIGAKTNNQTHDFDQERDRWYLRESILDFQDAVSSIENCNKPVIAVAHGISYGLAIDILCATDIRLCTETVRFSVKEVDIGIAADIGTLQRLPKIVQSQSWCKDVVFSGREFGCAEAKDHGFVSYVCPNKQQARAKALEIADCISSKSPVAVQGCKKLINYSREHSIADGLAYTAAWNAFAIGKDMQVAASSILQKKKPMFAKL